MEDWKEAWSQIVKIVHAYKGTRQDHEVLDKCLEIILKKVKAGDEKATEK